MELALSWQDITITLGNLVLLIAMVPEFAAKPQMSLWTSIPAALAMLALTVAYIGCGLVASSVACAITMFLWLVLVNDKVTTHKVPRRNRKV